MIRRKSRFLIRHPYKGGSYKDRFLIRNRSYKDAYKTLPFCNGPCVPLNGVLKRNSLSANPLKGTIPLRGFLKGISLK